MAVGKRPAAALRRNTQRILSALDAAAISSHTQRLLRTSPPLRVLGLDVNTNSTGFAIVNEWGRVCHWGHIPTTQFASADVLHIAAAIDQALYDLQQSLASSSMTTKEEEAGGQIEWRVGIEAFMRMYRFGRFHNAGIFQLAQLNGIVSYTCWKRFGALPVHTHPSSARGFFGISSANSTAKKSESIKQQVLRYVTMQEPNVVASDAIFQPNPRTGTLRDAAYDIADAYVIASYTRWQYVQSQLQNDTQLCAAFTHEYLQLMEQHSTNRKRSTKPTVEEQALATMDEHTKSAYLQELYVSSIEGWLKTNHDKLVISQEQEHKLENVCCNID